MDSSKNVLVGYYAVTISEFSNGTAILRWNVMDMATRKLSYENLSAVEQPARDPFTPEEMALMGALDIYSRRMGPDTELAW